MKVVILPRRAGKTRLLLEWVRAAERCDAYPFWTRIIITPDLKQADLLRDELRRSYIGNDGLYYNMVYAYEEWKTTQLGSSWEGEVGIDNLDTLLNYLFGHRGSVSVVTLNGDGGQL